MLSPLTAQETQAVDSRLFAPVEMTPCTLLDLITGTWAMRPSG